MIAKVWHEAGHDVVVVTATEDARPWGGPYAVSRSWSPVFLARTTAGVDLVASNGYSRAAVAAAAIGQRPVIVFHQGYQIICSDGLGFRNRQFHQFRVGRDIRLAFAAGVRPSFYALARKAVDAARFMAGLEESRTSSRAVMSRSA